MKYSIEPRYRYLHAELHGRESARDMKEFLTALKAACLEHGCPRILISVRESRAMFKLEDYGLSGYVNQLVTPACRLALLGDSSELHHAHEYVELVARQQKVNVRAFRTRAAAAEWLLSDEDLAGDPLAAGDGDSPEFKPT